MATKKTGISRELVIHPGETIADILEDRGITQAELAVQTKVYAKMVSWYHYLHKNSDIMELLILELHVAGRAITGGRTMGSYLNPPSTLFCGSLRSKIYVDKSGLIEKTNELICTEQKYIYISRLRRFGKSMTANMLVAYYKVRNKI